MSCFLLFVTCISEVYYCKGEKNWPSACLFCIAGDQTHTPLPPAHPAQPALCYSVKAFGVAKLINTVGSLSAVSALLQPHNTTGRGTLPREHLATFLAAFQWLISVLKEDSKH